MEPEIQARPTADDNLSRKQAPDAGKGAGPERRGIEWAFFGEDGFRVGWRLAAFALLLKILFRLVGFVVGTLHPAGGTGSFRPRMHSSANWQHSLRWQSRWP